MYSVGQAINCYIVKKTKTVGTQEVISFGCFLIEVGPWERNELHPHLESNQAVLQYLQSLTDLSTRVSAQKSLT